MARVLLYVAAGIIGLHGIVHLMGFVAYWPLAAVPELPYKTALLGDRWEVGPAGMRVFGLLWLVAAVGLLAVAAGLLGGRAWWRAVAAGTVALSTALIALDWTAAFRGAIVNVLIVLYLVWTLLSPGTAPH